MEAVKSYREGLSKQERALYFNKLKLIQGSMLSSHSVSMVTAVHKAAIRLLTLLYNALYRG